MKVVAALGILIFLGCSTSKPISPRAASGPVEKGRMTVFFHGDSTLETTEIHFLGDTVIALRPSEQQAGPGGPYLKAPATAIQSIEKTEFSPFKTLGAGGAVVLILISLFSLTRSG